MRTHPVPTVLVIDDDEAVRLSLDIVLKPEFETLGAGDGVSGLALLRLHGVDVVLLDLRLPGMAGLDVLSAIKALYPRLPVIVLTVVVDPPTIVDSMRRGAEDYITKPWDEGRLLRVMRVAAARGRGATQSVLVVGDDLERLAALQVILQMCAPCGVITPDSASPGPPFEPSVVVFDGGVNAERDATVVRAITERYPHCPLIVATRWPEALPAATGETAEVVAAPCRVSDIVNRIQQVLSRRLGRSGSGPWLGPHVSSAIDYLVEHYRAAVALADVARCAGLSVDRLSHVFRESVGMTMKEYATRLRVGIGCRLLADSDRKLEDIAQSLGFDHASHFSRVFTERMGVRPGEYRRRAREGHTDTMPLVWPEKA